MLEKLDENRTKVTSFAINDLKGSIPKFVANAGASNHSGIFNNLKKKLDQMDKNGTLPTVKVSF